MKGKKMKKILSVLPGLVMPVSGLGGCSGRERPNPEDPVTPTIWHVYGSQTESPPNNLIDEFNRTVGRENGVTIHVVYGIADDAESGIRIYEKKDFPILISVLIPVSERPARL